MRCIICERHQAKLLTEFPELSMSDTKFVRAFLFALIMLRLANSFHRNIKTYRVGSVSHAVHRIIAVGMSSAGEDLNVNQEKEISSRPQYSIEMYRPFGELGLIPNITDALLAKGTLLIEVC